MASAKKCDKCGSYYEEKCRPSTYIIKDNHPYSYEYVDLCPECLKKLKEWLKKVE